MPHVLHGARAHPGRIFLDEIGEVSQATQVKLLRVLDTSTFRHVGGTAEIRVDVRVLAATNRDLPALVRQGLFREDLYYRLTTITLRIPPLRERPGDVVILAEHFCRVLNDRFGFRKRIGPEALAILRGHAWPGNVRELLHVVEAALVLCEGQEVGPEHLPATLRPAAPVPLAVPALSGGRVPTLYSADAGVSWTELVHISDRAAGDAVDDMIPALAADGRGECVAVWQSFNPPDLEAKDSEWRILAASNRMSASAANPPSSAAAAGPAKQ